MAGENESKKKYKTPKEQITEAEPLSKFITPPDRSMMFASLWRAVLGNLVGSYLPNKKSKDAIAGWMSEKEGDKKANRSSLLSIIRESPRTGWLNLLNPINLIAGVAGALRSVVYILSDKGTDSIAKLLTPHTDTKKIEEAKSQHDKAESEKIAAKKELDELRPGGDKQKIDVQEKVVTEKVTAETKAKAAYNEINNRYSNKLQENRNKTKPVGTVVKGFFGGIVGLVQYGAQYLAFG
ncbi:MAG TPA: hypothetical protein VHZ76_03640, partial [Gammaproteobacteria bacterium]|nr:hypothetical protein [Gammaproteobacteria bacterium]